MVNDSFPILATDRLDYVDGAYDVAVSRAAKGAGMTIRHSVSGRNLVAHLLKRSEATFTVEVSAPYVTYREILRAEAAGQLETLQTISWNQHDVVPPVYFRPMVIATVAEPTNIVLNGEHGVHQVWQEVEVEVEPGLILATDRFWRAASTWESLIRLVSNDALPAGVYRVEASTGDGFHFKVHMHPNLFEKMVNPGDAHDHARSILTACLSRGLEIVKEEYGPDERWREFPVLRALHDKLTENSLPTWEVVEGFRPDEVATQLKPIIFGPDEDS